VIRIELLPPEHRLAAETKDRLQAQGRLVGVDRHLSLTPEQIHAEARARMAWVDALPREIRAILHEEGLPLVRKAIKAGNNHASQIRKWIANYKFQRATRYMELDL